jgi:hypothetical protein
MRRAALLVFLAACDPHLEPSPPRPTLRAEDPSQCANACRVLDANKCREGETTPDGVTCLDLCKRLAPLGLIRSGCIALAQDVPDLHMCGVRCLNKTIP